MKKIKLPTTAGFPEQEKWLQMEEYIRFINFSAAHFRKIQKNKRHGMNMLVDVPFSIK